MIGALYRPLGRDRLLLAMAAIVAATALYCVAYNALAGRSESLGTAALWAGVNILPWYLAFEAAKRSGSARRAALALAGAFAASMLLQIAAFGWPVALGFEMVRRIPALVLTVAVLTVGQVAAAARWRSGAAVLAGSPRTSELAGAAELPLPPAEVDWIAAAGNYVELRSGGRTILHRAPLSRVEEELGRHGFVRIHRSTLVRRDRIARVRPADVVLHDGTSLKTGKRYRSAVR